MLDLFWPIEHEQVRFKQSLDEPLNIGSQLESYLLEASGHAVGKLVLDLNSNK